MKPIHYVIAIAPVLYGIAESVKEFVPMKYAIWPVIVAAVAMYFMRSPREAADALPAVLVDKSGNGRDLVRGGSDAPK